MACCGRPAPSARTRTSPSACSTRGPRARARHHDPGQEHRDRLRRRQDQHRRYARPRRLRRRGRAGADHGRWRAAAGGCHRGTVAADALRAAQGARRTCRVILVVNKVDRPDARLTRSSTRSSICSSISAPMTHQLDFPIVYCQRDGRQGVARSKDEEASPSRPLLRPSARAHPRRLCTTPTTRSRRSSRTSTLRRTWAASRSAAFDTGIDPPGPAVRAGAAPMARSSVRRSPSCT